MYFLVYDLRSGVANVSAKQDEFHFYTSFGPRFSLFKNYDLTTSLFFNSIGLFKNGGNGVSQTGIKIALGRHLSNNLTLEAGIGWAIAQSLENKTKGFLDLSLN